MIYDELLEGFRRYLALEKNLAKNTELSYLRDVKLFLRYCDTNNINFVSITRSEFERYLLYLKNLGFKTSTLFRKTESIKAFYKFMFIEGRIDKNPFSEFSAPKLERKLPDYLSFDETERIINSFSAGDFKTLRTSAIIDLLYSSGLRISEVCNLTLDSVNLEQGWVRVKGKGSKERIVPIAQATIRLLKLYLDERNAILFKKRIDASDSFFVNKSGKRISRVQVWKDIKDFVKKVGIERNVYPHLFRHTFATHLLQRGADLRSIGEMLGHASLNTTQIYTHLDKSALKNIHRKYHPRG